MNSKIYTTTNKIRRASNVNPNNMLLPIPATIRDLVDLQHGQSMKWEVYIENNEKYIKLSKTKTD